MVIVSALIKGLFFGIIFLIIYLVVKHYTNRKIKEKEAGDILLNNIRVNPDEVTSNKHKSKLESKIDEIEDLYRQKKISKGERDSFISTILNNYTKK